MSSPGIVGFRFIIQLNQLFANILSRIAAGDPAPVEKAGEFTRVIKEENDQGKNNGPRRIADALPDIENAPMLILVDQFEEIYSLCDTGSRTK